MAATSRLHQIFCDNVRIHREKLGFTQVDMAKKMRITQAYYSNVESGRNPPNLETIEKFAKAFKVEPYELLAPQAVAA